MNRVTVTMLTIPRCFVFPEASVIYGSSMTCGPGWVTVLTGSGARHHFPITNVARVIEEDVDE